MRKTGFGRLLAWTIGIALGMALLYVLFPPIGRPRQAIRKSKCLGNLKNIAQALVLYADEYNGQLPSSYLVSHSKKWNARDARIFCSGLGTFPPRLGTHKQTWPQVLYDRMGSPNIIFCPSDAADAARPSYWYKLANDKAWYGIGCKAPRRSMSDYAYESDQIAFYEHCGWHFGDDSGRVKNGVQYDMAFMDTHVATILLTNATCGDPINCAANSDGEPMYYNCKDTGPNSKPDPGPARHTDPTTCCDNL